MNPKPTRVLVNGALGKMGAMACETLKGQQDFELVGALTRQDNLAKAIVDTKAEVVVDLTRADCVFDNSLCIIQQGARPVIGTSGLLSAQIEELAQLCEAQQLGGIVAPNFSIGAVLMMQFAAKAATYFSEVEIIETHHQNKLDAPSGTAMKTAELIAKARKSKNKLELKELVPSARGGLYQDVSIHSLRLPGILARQEVLFGGLGETLSIKHHSTDRQSFMGGIVFSCRKVLELSTLVYGLEHLL
jgi:4-hydroxy-tetrahydrodipicolinate reductase